MSEKINDGGPAFPTESGGQSGNTTWRFEGMTMRDYAAIRFAAEWTAILGNTVMNESREQRGAEAVRLGLLQADAFIKARQS